MTLSETKQKMLADRENQMVYLMDFVQDFRRQPDAKALEEPFPQTNEQLDALLASTAEALCAEAKLAPPSWIREVKPTKFPYFVSGIENLKAIALVESPVWFRKRNVFVLKNFLDRV